MPWGRLNVIPEESRKAKQGKGVGRGPDNTGEAGCGTRNLSRLRLGAAQGQVRAWTYFRVPDAAGRRVVPAGWIVTPTKLAHTQPTGLPGVSTPNHDPLLEFLWLGLAAGEPPRTHTLGQTDRSFSPHTRDACSGSKLRCLTAFPFHPHPPSCFVPHRQGANYRKRYTVNLLVATTLASLQ